MMNAAPNKKRTSHPTSRRTYREELVLAIKHIKAWPDLADTPKMVLWHLLEFMLALTYYAEFKEVEAWRVRLGPTRIADELAFNLESGRVERAFDALGRLGLVKVIKRGTGPKNASVHEINRTMVLQGSNRVAANTVPPSNRVASNRGNRVASTHGQYLSLKDRFNQPWIQKDPAADTAATPGLLEGEPAAASAENVTAPMTVAVATVETPHPGVPRKSSKKVPRQPEGNGRGVPPRRPDRAVYEAEQKARKTAYDEFAAVLTPVFMAYYEGFGKAPDLERIAERLTEQFSILGVVKLDLEKKQPVGRYKYGELDEWVKSPIAPQTMADLVEAAQRFAISHPNECSDVASLGPILAEVVNERLEYAKTATATR